MSLTFEQMLNRFIDTDIVCREDIPIDIIQEALDEFERYYTFGNLFYLAVEYNGQLHISPVFCTLAYSDRESAYMYEIAEDYGENVGYDGYSGLMGSMDFFYPISSVKQVSYSSLNEHSEERFIIDTYHIADDLLTFTDLNNPSLELLFDDWKRGLPIAKRSKAGNRDIKYPHYNEDYPYKACFVNIYDYHDKDVSFGYTVIKAGSELFNRLASHVKKGGY